LVACGGGGSSNNSGTAGATNSSGGSGAAGSSSGRSGAAGSSGSSSGAAGSSNGGSGTSGGGAGTAGASGSGGTAGAAGIAGAGGTGNVTSADLCAGLVEDKLPHTGTTLPKPAVGMTVTDAEFGTTIRRITAAPAPSAGNDSAIVPMYSTISAWNADESLMILYQVGSDGGHKLYDGKTYAALGALDVSPPDLEQVYWDTSDPDLLYYVDGQDFIRYHVQEKVKDTLTSFASLCAGDAPTNGDDPMFTSWDSHRLGLTCNGQMFIYDLASNQVLGPKPVAGTPPAQVAPSGKLAYLEAGTGQVFDENLNLVRSLNLQVPDNHASLGQLANGHDTWNGAVYDDDNNDVGSLVTWDLTDGSGGVVIGPKTGYPYPPDGHISALAYREPGWVVVSTISDNTTGPQVLLDQELLIADTNSKTVCRVGRHRSFGKNNTNMQEPYWAEPHAVPSPSGTRILFASDWGNGATVDSYVLELPSYVK
jgi:hypothetical protein